MNWSRNMLHYGIRRAFSCVYIQVHTSQMTCPYNQWKPKEEWEKGGSFQILHQLYYTLTCLRWGLLIPMYLKRTRYQKNRTRRENLGLQKVHKPYRCSSRKPSTTDQMSIMQTFLSLNTEKLTNSTFPHIPPMVMSLCCWINIKFLNLMELLNCSQLNAAGSFLGRK